MTILDELKYFIKTTSVDSGSARQSSQPLLDSDPPRHPQISPRLAQRLRQGRGKTQSPLEKIYKSGGEDFRSLHLDKSWSFTSADIIADERPCVNCGEGSRVGKTGVCNSCKQEIMGSSNENQRWREIARKLRQERAQERQAGLYHHDDEEWMRGQCAAYAEGLHKLKPNLKLGIHWEINHPGDSGYDEELAMNHPNYDEDDESTWPTQSMPQHYFAHDDKYAYDAMGRHPLPYKDWDKTTLNHDWDEIWHHGMYEGGYVDDAMSHARQNDVFNREPRFGRFIKAVDGGGVSDSWSTRQWPDPFDNDIPSHSTDKECTCKEGKKLDCPVHGLHGDMEDRSWAIPEASPVGYPQDAPRNWQIAITSSARSWDIAVKSNRSDNFQMPEHKNPELVAVDDLLPYQEFDRRPGAINDKGELAGYRTQQEWDAMKQDIAQNGIQEPLILEFDPDSGCASLGEGNHRLQMAQELGMTHVPVRGMRGSRPADFGKRLMSPNEVIADRFGYFPGNFPPSYIGIPTAGQWSKEGRTINSDKFNDFLNNPKARPDLQTPEAQDWLGWLGKNFHNEKTDALTPWLTREWKKGRIKQGMPQSFGPQGMYYLHEGEPALPKVIQPAVLNHWADFYHSNHPVRRGLGDIMQHDVSSFGNQIGDWETAMEQEAEAARQKEMTEGGEVVHQWPDGWSIRKLHTPRELRAEGDAMGHCVGGYNEQVQNGSSSIYSLRDPRGMPHVTTEIQPKYVQGEDGRLYDRANLSGSIDPKEYVPHGGKVIQIQGRGNQEPIPEYVDRMKDWFGSMNGRPPVISQPDIDDLHDVRWGSDNEEGYKEKYGLSSDDKPNVDWDNIVAEIAKGNHRWDDPTRVIALAKETNEGESLERVVDDMKKKYEDKIDKEVDDLVEKQDPDLYLDHDAWDEFDKGNISEDEYFAARDEAYDDLKREIRKNVANEGHERLGDALQNLDDLWETM